MADLCCMAEANIGKQFSSHYSLLLYDDVLVSAIQQHKCRVTAARLSSLFSPCGSCQVACSVSLSHAGLDTLRYSAPLASWQGPLTLSSFMRPSEPACPYPYLVPCGHCEFVSIWIVVALIHDFPGHWFTDCLLSEFPGGQPCAAAPWICTSFVSALPLGEAPLTLPWLRSSGASRSGGGHQEVVSMATIAKHIGIPYPLNLPKPWGGYWDCLHITGRGTGSLQTCQGLHLLTSAPLCCLTPLSAVFPMQKPREGPLGDQPLMLPGLCLHTCQSMTGHVVLKDCLV